MLTAASRAFVSLALSLTTGASAALAFSTASSAPVSVTSTCAGLTCHFAGSTPSPATRTTRPGSLRVTSSSSIVDLDRRPARRRPVSTPSGVTTSASVVKLSARPSTDTSRVRTVDSAASVPSAPRTLTVAGVGFDLGDDVAVQRAPGELRRDLDELLDAPVERDAHGARADRRDREARRQRRSCRA